MTMQTVKAILSKPVTADFTSEMKFTAIAYAYFAKSDGTDIYPSVKTVSSFTGYHERSIQRFQRRLVKAGILIPDGQGRKGTNKYKLNPSIIWG